jgi:hypothetical protein
MVRNAVNNTRSNQPHIYTNNKTKQNKHVYKHVYIYIYIYMCVCVCVCTYRDVDR